jgi:HSP20 family molecular chaperone IbpA
MSSTPVGPNSTPLNYPGTSRPKAQARVSSSDTPNAAASATEREAQQRIASAQQNVTDAQNQASQQLDQVKDQYNFTLENETAREDDAIEKQRLKGYEALRDLKRQQEAEMHKTKAEGERELTKLSDYYRDTTYAAHRKGDADLNEIKSAQGREMEHDTKSGQLDSVMAKSEQDRKLADLRETQQTQYNQLYKESADKYEQLKAKTIVESERANEHFQGNYKATIEQDQKALDILSGKANSEITQLRTETSQKLAAYGDRQGDPFYKLKDLGAALHEDGDKFTLTARIPAHEQEHVNVSISGNHLIVSGARRNEEKLDLGPGRSKSSASYQTYQESFPLSWPVEKNQLMKEFHGDTLVVTVPKSGPFAKLDTPKSEEPPPRLRAERPHFPGNLPTAQSVQKGESESEVNSGSRPLT